MWQNIVLGVMSSAVYQQIWKQRDAVLVDCGSAPVNNVLVWLPDLPSGTAKSVLEAPAHR